MTSSILIGLLVAVFMILGIVGRCIKFKQKGVEKNEQKSDTEHQD